MPATLSIEPAAVCNLKCSECVTGRGLLKRENNFIDFGLFKKIIEESSSYLITLNLYFQGEPFLSKDFFKMLKVCSERKIFTIVSTNGHFLDQKVVVKLMDNPPSRILISLDGVSQDSYEKYRVTGDFNKVINGIKNLVKEKERRKYYFPEIVLQTLVFEHNVNELHEIKNLQNELRVNKFEIKTPQVLFPKKDSTILSKEDKYNRYRKYNPFMLRLLPGLLNSRCLKSALGGVITTDGDFVPCCFDKNAEFKYGNIIDKSVKEVWTSENADNFHQQIKKHKQQIEICKNCSEWY